MSVRRSTGTKSRALRSSDASSPQLDARSLRGTLLVVPVQNPLAFQVQHRYFVGHMLRSPMDQNPADPWASFPGDPNGNLAALIAHVLFDQLMRHAQLHGGHSHADDGRQICAIRIFARRRGAVEPSSKRRSSPALSAPITSLPTIKACMWATKTLIRSWRRRGVPAIGVEIGEGGRSEEVDVNVGCAD